MYQRACRQAASVGFESGWTLRATRIIEKGHKFNLKRFDSRAIFQ